jgi:hypothetical protein
MSAFPYFSNIAPHVQAELARRKDDLVYVSRLNCWVRASSGVGAGLMIYSNPDFQLFKAMGSTGTSIYGNNTSSGTIGVRWDGTTAVNASGDFWGFRPPPIITSIQIDEGAGSLSRKAEFSITAYTKAQLNTLCKYFLEPGYTIFLEFGWNTRAGVSAYKPNLSAGYVGAFQSFDLVNRARKNTNGHYDNYLGFITGGSIAMNGDTWTMNVKCTGFTELPAFLNAADSSEAVEKNEEPVGQYFKPTAVNAETDLGRKRFMMAFNRLPSNKQSQRVANLINDKTVANFKNFINVDENVKENINDTTTGTEIFGFSINDEEVKSEDKNFEVPSGTRLIGDESFIRFGTLMKIINTIGAEGFYIGQTLVKNHVNTENTVCSAFKLMFSTDKSKLFIPNNKAPFFSVFTAATTDTTSVDTKRPNPCNIEDIYFPSPTPIIAGVADKKSIQFVGPDMNGVSKDAFEWGLLDNLYVNMDFVKGILETKNFLVKDALFQILNGMSSAAGGIWDFQIQESSTKSGGSTELTVVDMNFIPKGDGGMAILDVVGVSSVFMDANLDLEISGMKMNQVIAKRLNYTANSSSSPVDVDGNKGLFTNEPDLVLQSIKKSNAKTAPVQVKTETPPTTPPGPTAAEVAAKAKDVLVDQTFAANAKDRNVVGNFVNANANLLSGAGNTIAAGFFSLFGNEAEAQKYQAAAAEDFAQANESHNEAVNDSKTFISNAGDTLVQAGEVIADATGATALYEMYKKWSDKEEAKEKNFQQFLDKLGAYPRVNITSTDAVGGDGVNLESICYLACYNDQLTFESFKNGYDKAVKNSGVSISALMPIKFSFTVHGVSGIKRGDKFKVRGIPTQYETGGFFQVTAVKQVIEGQMWKTEVEGQFRLARKS